MNGLLLGIQSINPINRSPTEACEGSAKSLFNKGQKNIRVARGQIINT